MKKTFQLMIRVVAEVPEGMDKLADVVNRLDYEVQATGVEVDILDAELIDYGETPTA
jgi:hypothetical protein